MPKYNLKGQKLNRWTVVGDFEIRPYTSPSGRLINFTFWYCRCECGTEKFVQQTYLISGKSASCGCWRDDLLISNSTRHGRSTDPVYGVWRGMIKRCYLPSNISYPNYGGRGIKVCDLWRGPNGFLNFLADMGEIPLGYTLERIDVNGDYEPSNCSWATMEDQQNNKRNNVFIEIDGQRLTKSQWAKLIGVDHGTITRHHKRGQIESYIKKKLGLK